MTGSELIARCFFLAGPTAVGKTDLAVALAETCGGEIVGADAFQIYQGLDLLTAKPSREALARVPHHLIGSVPLTEPYHAGRYVEEAFGIIRQILARGRLPIIAGGTGLYLRALTRGLSDAPPADLTLRAELNTTPLPELLAQLQRLDPEAAVSIDCQNPRRVTRALEIVIQTGKPLSAFRQEWDTAPAFQGLFVQRPREELHERIHRRTVAMFEHGVVEEVRQVFAIGETAAQVLGWKPIQALLRGEISQATCLAEIETATRQYAKRQITWFRREPQLTPVTLTDETADRSWHEALAMGLSMARSMATSPAEAQSGLAISPLP